MTKLLVISDSSSLIIGTKAGLLNPICKAFKIEIPEKVFEDTVTIGKKLGKIDALKIEENIKSKHIIVKKIKPIKDKKKAKCLTQLNLDEGEKQAVELYIQTNAKLLLADDKQAINAAKLLEINWTTIPSLIVTLAIRKKITRNKALDALMISQEEGRYKLNFIMDAFKKIDNLKGGKK